jgi:hypothetical protein
METCIAPPVIVDTMARSGFERLTCEGWFDLFRSYVGQKQGNENGQFAPLKEH